MAAAGAVRGGTGGGGGGGSRGAAAGGTRVSASCVVCVSLPRPSPSIRVPSRRQQRRRPGGQRSWGFRPGLGGGGGGLRSLLHLQAGDRAQYEGPSSRNLSGAPPLRDVSPYDPPAPGVAEPQVPYGFPTSVARRAQRGRDARTDTYPGTHHPPTTHPPPPLHGGLQTSPELQFTYLRAVSTI